MFRYIPSVIHTLIWEYTVWWTPSTHNHSVYCILIHHTITTVHSFCTAKFWYFDSVSSFFNPHSFSMLYGIFSQFLFLNKQVIYKQPLAHFYLTLGKLQSSLFPAVHVKFWNYSQINNQLWVALLPEIPELEDRHANETYSGKYDNYVNVDFSKNTGVPSHVLMLILRRVY